MQQVITSSIVVITTRIIWEIITQRGAREFFGKKINLVQEKNLSRVCKGEFEARQERLTIEVLTNHLELHIESKSVRASCIRF